MTTMNTMSNFLIRSALFLSVAAILSSSCRHSPTEAPAGVPTVAKDSIIPLNIGNKWTWQLTLYDTLGKPYSTYLDSLRIDSAKNINSEHWCFPGHPYEKLAFANLSDGCYYRAFDDTPGASFLFYRYPARANDTYRAPSGVVSGYRVWIVDTLESMTILSIDTTITVPAGTFTCYLYRRARKDGVHYFDEFLAPGLGWIRVVTYPEIWPGRGVYFKQSTKDLIQFTPGS